MARKKIETVVDVVMNIASDVKLNQKEKLGEQVLDNLFEYSDNTVHQTIMIPNDLNTLTSLYEAFDKYRSFKKMEGVSPETLKNLDRFYKVFHAFITPFTVKRDEREKHTEEQLDIVAHITPISVLVSDRIDELFRDYLEDVRELAPMSVFTIMTLYRAFYNWLSIEMGVLPPRVIKIKRVRAPIKALYTDEQLDKLLEKPKNYRENFVAHRDWLVVVYTYNTGNRARSIVNIQMKDLVELNDGYIILNKTKNGKPERTVVPPQVIKLLREYIKLWRSDADAEDYLFTNQYGEPIKAKYLGAIVAKYNKSRLGEGAPTSIHLFRHQYAAEFMRDDGNMFDLQKQLGHSTLDMVRHYAEHYGKPNRDNIISHAPINRRKIKGGRVKIK